MILWALLAALGLGGVITGSPTVTAPPDAASHTHAETVEESKNSERVKGISAKPAVVGTVEETIEVVMELGELNPNHYPAQRAAKVVEHYLNTQHGSPYKVFTLHRVLSASAEDVPDSGRKYQLKLSVQESVHHQTIEECLAEVLFPTGESHAPPQVQVSSCEDLLKINVTVQEENLYQQYKRNDSHLFAQNLPDSYGHMEPEHVPFWHLGIVVSSFVMLSESTQDTLYNMAQVANVSQLATEDNLLKFDYDVLLHERVSQEIFAWKMLVTWSPSDGVKVLKMEKKDYTVKNLKITLL
ncbi:latexin isoform X2 [Syngnathoides biaculeatus]|uniref:latexin isoform X2 n=1 Tax=Syngnathoides biaculeatus TaxID=300417 RepID=UPI002ADDD5DE|nr:latexin isoform X2 [Syngnathoides biaculeatus]